jgi:hypothetical protein
MRSSPCRAVEDTGPGETMHFAAVEVYFVF